MFCLLTYVTLTQLLQSKESTRAANSRCISRSTTLKKYWKV